MSQRVLFIIKEIEGAEPLGALYVAGCLQEAGHDCHFIGTRGNDVLDSVRYYQPDVVAFGATTGLHRYYLGLNAHIKEHYPNCLSLMGGPHATYFPDVVHTPGLDVIVRGEAEDASVDLIEALDNGGDYRAIPDLWVKHEDKIYRNEGRPLRRDIASIPHPPRELLYDYDDRLRMRPLKSFTTNRGCPFPCSYCFNPSLAEYYGNGWSKVRIRSPENVVEELRRVRSQGPLHVVAFRESIFVYNAKWLRRFGELYREAIGLPYYCHLRADLLTEEMVELLAWSGCHTVNLGIETANEGVANDVLKRNIKMHKLITGIKLLKKAGIVVFADNIIGIPGGTLEEDFATLQLNIDLDVDYAAATLCTPYPGTGIADYAIEHGYFNGDFELIDDSYYTESVLEFINPEEKRQTENLHKFFAVTAALPWIKPMVRQLIKLPANDYFYSIFRAWYLVCHMTDVMPRRPNLQQMKESLLSIFGIFEGEDPNWHSPPRPEWLQTVDVPKPSQQKTVELRTLIRKTVARVTELQLSLEAL